MWTWYINGEKVPYQNRNLQGAAKDMDHIIRDWAKGQILMGEATLLSEVKLVWVDPISTPEL